VFFGWYLKSFKEFKTSFFAEGKIEEAENR